MRHKDGKADRGDMVEDCEEEAEELRLHSTARVNNLNVLRGLEEAEGVCRKRASNAQSVREREC